MTLDRRACNLEVDWLAEAYNHKAVILVLFCCQTIKQAQNLVANEEKSIC